MIMPSKRPNDLSYYYNIFKNILLGTIFMQNVIGRAKTGSGSLKCSKIWLASSHATDDHE